MVAGNSFGNSGGNIVLVRYDPDGSLDTAFGVAGISITAPFVDLVAMALQPDGRIVAGGIAAGTGGVGEDMALARYQGVQAAPAFTFAPRSGPVGWPVSISGTGLTGTTAVTFNGVAATFTVDSDTHLTALVPVGASSGSISVTTPAGTSTSTESFAVTTARRRDAARSTSSPSSRPTVRAPSPRRDGTPSSRFPTMTPSVGSTDAGG